MDWFMKPAILRRTIFVYELVWAVILIGVAFAYFKSDTLQDWVPTTLRGLPLDVAWAGAVGGVVISLHGVYEHASVDKMGKNLWADGWPLWYFGRPISGMVAGIITYVLFKAVYPSGSPTPAVVIAAALILGMQENRFFAFIAKVGALIVAVPKGSDAK